MKTFSEEGNFGLSWEQGGKGLNSDGQQVTSREEQKST